MANTNTAGFGLRQTMTVGSTPATGGQSEFSVQSLSTLPNDMLKGDPVGYQTTAGAHGATVGYIQDVTYAGGNDDTATGVAWTTALAPVVGVFNGGFWNATTTNKPTWGNSIPGGTVSAVDYNTGVAGITAFVNTNPNQEYTVRTSAALTPGLTELGNTEAYNLIDQPGSGQVEGQSACTLSSGAVVSSGMFFVNKSANVPGQTDSTAAGYDVVASFNPSAMIYN
jgi:hypothetical protein